jgi:hypothetical protein
LCSPIFVGFDFSRRAMKLRISGTLGTAVELRKTPIFVGLLSRLSYLAMLQTSPHPATVTRER